MARRPKDDHATSLKPNDRRQLAKKGTKIGLRPKKEVMAGFRKIIKTRWTIGAVGSGAWIPITRSGGQRARSG